jgi:type VI secretion system protein VasI
MTAPSREFSGWKNRKKLNMEKKFELLITSFLARYGKEILDDPAKCKGLLKDFAKNEYRRECQLFLQIVEAGYHKTILGVKDKDIAPTANRLAAQLQRDFFLGADVAKEVIVFLFRVLRSRNLGTPTSGQGQTRGQGQGQGQRQGQRQGQGQTQTTTIAPSNADKGKWNITTEMSPIDDSEIVTLSLQADSVIGGSTPSLIIQCKGRNTQVIFNLGRFPKIEDGVTLRIDKTPAFKLQAVGLNNPVFISLPSPVDLIKKLMTGSSLVFEYTPYGRFPETTTFQIKGLDVAIKPIRNIGRW